MKKQFVWVSMITSTLMFSCMEHEMDKKELNINFDAAYIVNGESNSISVINLSTDEVVGTISLGDESMAGHGGMTDEIMWPHHAYINSTKSILAIGVPGTDLSAGHAGGMDNMMGKVALLDAVKGTVSRVIDLEMMNHNAVFSPDGSEIWTSQMDDMGTVVVYNATTYALKATIEVGADPAEVTFSADGSVAFVANGGSNTVTAINPSTKQVLSTIDVGADPVGAWPGSDNRMYVDNEEGQTISVVNVSTLAVEATIDLGFMPGYAAYNEMHNELWVTDPDNGKVHYWTKDGTTWTHGGAFDTRAGAHAIAFTSDEMKAYVTNQSDASVSVVNVSTHAVTKTIAVGKKPNGIVLKQ
ncbi:MAG: YncE family protein [Cytophagales bacterium]|nr:YncE family protein [Cytophagales bacterium]